MTIRRKFMILAGIAVLPALLASGCYHRSPEQRAEQIVQHLSSELGLDAAQKGELEKIKNDILARRLEMVQVQEKAVGEMNALMRSPEIDKAKLDLLVEAQQARTADSLRFIARNFTEVHNMLRPDQRDKLAAMAEKHMEKRRSRSSETKGS